MNIETHRGIPTNPTPRYEIKLKTITNRWGQLSLSLPRIDDKKRWAGFPGNTGISKRLARVIPECRLYCEPFAGTAKVAQELYKLNPCPAEKICLNEKSPKIFKWLYKNFPHFAIKNQDFVACVKEFDAVDTVFLFDPPWYKSYYDQIFSTFDRKNVAAYEDEILEICKTIQGKFFITTRIESMRMRNSGYRNLLIKSEYVVAGKYPQVLVTTNDFS